MIYGSVAVDFGKDPGIFFNVVASGLSLSIMTIAKFDRLDIDQKKKLLYECCGSTAWVDKMLAIPAAEDLIDLFEDAEESWYSLTESDWKEAFFNHRHVSDRESLKKRISEDQIGGGDFATVNASEQTLQALLDGNKTYEGKFGYTFVANSAGKSAVEVLGILTARLQNKPETELTIAVSEQNKITQQRLERLFDD
jgi:2-oxo-4-hydroxy-4-carboxy-5-ureidoimidazoline decarboxylase